MKIINIKLTEEVINECLKDSLEKIDFPRKEKKHVDKKTRPAIM